MIDVRISFPLIILRMNGQNLTKFCKHIHVDKILVGIVNHYFSQICNRVTALDRCQNFVSAQYFVQPNFDYTLTMLRSRLEFLIVIVYKFDTELWPLIHVRISFPLNILRTKGQNLTKFCTHIHIDKI